MARSPEAQDARVSMGAQAIRYAIATAASLPLPTETSKPKSEGWRRAEQLNKENYGIIIAHMHADKGDVPRIIGRTFRSSIFGSREIILPNAIHRYQDWYGLAGVPIHVQVLPVFTPETRRLTQEDTTLAQKLKDKYGIDIKDIKLSRVIARYTEQYIDHAISLLKRAGVEIVAPQGHRESAFITMTTAIESILKRALRQNIHHIAVLFIGYDIKGVNNYGEKLSSYNLFKTYRFHDGKCLTVDELLTEAGENVGKLNDVIRKEMKAIIPSQYLPEQSMA